MEQYRGIIFDFNGTLFFDSEKHLKAWREFSGRLRGTAFSDEEMRDYMFGRTNKDIIAYAIGKEPSNELVEALSKEKEKLYRDMCHAEGKNCKLAPYAVKFLNYLKESNFPRTIATMSEKDNVEFYIEHFELANWFDIDKIVYSDGRIKGKPAPDIYEIAAKKLELKPEECIVVEDAVSGIEAAKAANIGKIVAIASMEPVDLYRKIPDVDMVIKDFSNFEGILAPKSLSSGYSGV